MFYTYTRGLLLYESESSFQARARQDPSSESAESLKLETGPGPAGVSQVLRDRQGGTNTSFSDLTLGSPSPTAMSTCSYIFEGPNPDVILRTPLQQGSDEFKDFHVHKLILSLASITFRDTFSIPQPPRHSSDDTALDIVQVTESANVLETFLQLIYPVDPPVIEDLRLVDDLFWAADKYAASCVTTKLKRRLVSPSFLKDDPIGVFAIACRNDLHEEARLALPHTFIFNIIHQISEDHLRIMTTKTYHRLLTEHDLRRKQLIGSIDAAWRSLDPQTRCRCMKRVEENIHTHICGRPFLNKETLESCLSLAEHPNCGAGGYCIKVLGQSSFFLSDAMRRMQVL